jgi:uncharacterized protein YndB with AHSA1/START domain
MSNNKVIIEALGDDQLVIRREFKASRNLVFQAHTECKYLKRWMFGPDGWSLDVCNIDLNVGGRYRYVWKKGEIEMGAGGEYREISEPEKLVCTEQFDDPWYPGIGLATIELTETDGVTTLTNTIKYESKEARDTVLESPMEDGLEMGYARLDSLLSEKAAAA